ncbi:MAG: ABC transporter permease [Synergistetes bacterium]|nr:ABC transporter permease [Synergistota bacterium]
MGSLRRYIVVRLLLAVPMVLILLTMVFFIMRIMPGDPVTALLGPKAPPSVVANMRHRLGLDEPLFIQYISYLGRLLHGDMGTSMLTERPVFQEIMERFPATLELTLYAMLFAVLVGIFMGTESARRQDSFGDVFGRMYTIIIYSIPVFWLGMLFQVIFGVNLHWLPISGRVSPMMDPHKITSLYTIDALLTGDWESFRDVVAHLVLPAITLGLVISSIFVRMVRGNMVLTLNMDFVRAARARGIRENAVVYRHALKNALVPILTIMGLQFALLLAGAVLTETTFSWPGIGSYLIMRIRYRDFAGIQGAIVFYALLVVTVSILIDVIDALVDPRVRY